MLAHAWLERLGLSGLHGRCYRELSGGQRQRVLLARALCASRSLLMLDEPVSGLDPEASAEMYAALRRLNREDRLTIVMVSHDVAAAVREAGRILHLGLLSYLFHPSVSQSSSLLPLHSSNGFRPF